MPRLWRLRALAPLLVITSLLSPYAARVGHADPTATSFIYPVGNPNIPPTWDPTNGNGFYITQGFNDSCDPSLGQGYYAYGLYYCGHTGVDLATDGFNLTIHAVAAGVVTEAQEDDGYGVTVRIRHVLANGTYVYSQYEHMQYGSLQVYAGETVRQGQPLGLVGSTGFSSGAHLHFELKNFDGGGPGYTFGNAAEIAPFYDPLSFVAAHAIQPMVYVTPSGHAIPEWPAESAQILERFSRRYTHFVVVGEDHGLFVRAGPGIHYRPLGIALKGAKLGFLRRKGGWLNVALPQEVRGWVSLQWVQGYGYWDTPWPPRGPVAVVDTVGLNIHANPGQNHTVLGICFQGDVVAIRASTAHWTEVSTREGSRGWVLSRYLLRPGRISAHGGGVTILATAQVLNVRSGPGEKYPKVGSVFQGTPMQLVRLSPHWAAVVLPGGTTGWVARSYTNLEHRPARRARSTRRGRPARPAHVIYLRVAVGVVNIRSAPGERHPVVARALLNTPLQVLSATAHWVHVALPASSFQGWALRRLLR